MVLTFSSKGPSINDVTPEGEGGGTLKKVTRGDKGRDPIFSRGDVTSKLLFYYKSYNLNSILGLFLRLVQKNGLFKGQF